MQAWVHRCLYQLLQFPRHTGQHRRLKLDTRSAQDCRAGPPLPLTRPPTALGTGQGKRYLKETRHVCFLEGQSTRSHHLWVEEANRDLFLSRLFPVPLLILPRCSPTKIFPSERKSD